MGRMRENQRVSNENVLTSFSFTSVTASESKIKDFPFLSQSLKIRTRIFDLLSFGNLKKTNSLET